jgi:hypothetical protein
MRRAGFLLVALVLVGLAWWSRGQTDAVRFIVPANPIQYATTFDGGKFAEDWSVEERRGYVVAADNDQLTLTIQEAVFMAGAASSLRATNRYLFRDFDLQVTTIAESGPLNNSFGVVFRQLDPQTYYTFYISSDGYYSVWYESAEASTRLSDWIASDVIQQGVDGARNTIRVIADGDTFSFLVNGQQLDLCIPDDPAGQSTMAAGECVDGSLQPTLTDTRLPYGQIGLILAPIASGEQAIAFDNVVVRSPSS